jgi:hypothetical protein
LADFPKKNRLFKNNSANILLIKLAFLAVLAVVDPKKQNSAI